MTPTTAPHTELPRRAVDEDVSTGIRVFWGPDPGQFVDWDRRLLAFEAVAARTVNITLPRLLNAPMNWLADAEATAAFVWVLRRHRGGERDLPYAHVEKTLDLMCVYEELIDRDGIILDVAPQPLDPSQRELMLAGLVKAYTDCDNDTAVHTARAVVAGLGLPDEPAPETEGDGPGEDDAAAGQPAAAGSSTSPTT